MTLTLGLGAALSGLLSTRKGLDLTAHNIANVNTEGFTKKSLTQVTHVLNGHGVGVEVMNTTREVDWTRVYCVTPGVKVVFSNSWKFLAPILIAFRICSVPRRLTPPSVVPSMA